MDMSPARALDRPHDPTGTGPLGWPPLSGGALARYRRQYARLRDMPDAGGMPSMSWRASLMHAGAGSAPWLAACARVDRACREHLGITPYEVQWLAALAMMDGRLVEMATGEGKTLATALAAAVSALAGHRVHVLTANPYLVERDAAWLAAFYDALGLRVATVAETDALAGRRVAYRAEVVYATAKAVVFDALRDEACAHGATGALMVGARVLVEGTDAAPVLPRLDTVFIDEADSILVDEASVPLVVSALRPDCETTIIAPPSGMGALR